MPSFLIESFTYLDDNGIESLFSQIGKPYVDEVIHRETREIKGKASSEIKLGKVLALLGIAEADAEGGLDYARASSEEFTAQLKTENKLKIVMDALDSKHLLLVLDFGDYMKAAGGKEQSNPLDQITTASFVDFTGWFDTRILRNAELSSGTTNSFVEFPSCDLPLIMGTSMDKYKLGLNHVRVQMGLVDSCLKVFGELTPVANRFYLKPFAFVLKRGEFRQREQL